jgi:hypothetical protein
MGHDVWGKTHLNGKAKSTSPIHSIRTYTCASTSTSLPAVARASASRHRSYHSYAYRNTCFRLRLLPKHVLVARTYLVIQVSSRLPIIISNNVERHHDVIVALKLRIPARASRYS